MRTLDLEQLVDVKDTCLRASGLFASVRSKRHGSAVSLSRSERSAMRFVPKCRAFFLKKNVKKTDAEVQ